MAADEQRDRSPDPFADTSESPAIGAPETSSAEGAESPAEAQRAAEGRPTAPHNVAVTSPPAEDAPEGTGPEGEVRGGYGVGATGPEGGTDVRGPSDTGSAGGGQSPAEAQRRADDATDDFSERPHLYVAGAFVGGLVVAQILKRIGGGSG